MCQCSFQFYSLLHSQVLQVITSEWHIILNYTKKFNFILLLSQGGTFLDCTISRDTCIFITTPNLTPVSVEIHSLCEVSLKLICCWHLFASTGIYDIKMLFFCYVKFANWWTISYQNWWADHVTYYCKNHTPVNTIIKDAT